MKFITRLQSKGSDWYASRYIQFARLEMPDNKIEKFFSRSTTQPRAHGDHPAVAKFILASVVTLTCVSLIVYGVALADAMNVEESYGVLDIIFILVASVSFSWVVFNALNMMIGFIVTVTGGRLINLNVRNTGTGLEARTALLFPIYHEESDRLAARIVDLIRELEQRNASKNFDIYVLSDSQDKDVIAEELQTFGALSRDNRTRIAITYRNRSNNSGKKASNISDWVKNFGARHDYFIVLDADSFMTATCLLTLVATMEAKPNTGLIQTFPRISGARTRFARLQQFANNLYGPVSASGISTWQGASGNYWGHNAIIRTRAFADVGGLPTLPGPPPWGGHIRSHDFVEAALLRHAGWQISLAPALPGSLEGCPPNVITLAARDRRWVQGNFQHLPFLVMPGLDRINRLHMGLGIFGYLSSFFWLTMILVGLMLLWRQPDFDYSYFSDQKTLFPVWPSFNPEAGIRIFAVTILVLFLPKLLGLVLGLLEHLKSGWHPARIGKFLYLWFNEVLASVLMAPVYMLLHVQSIIEVLRSKDSGWSSQERLAGYVDLGEATAFHKFHVAVGLALAVASYSHSAYALAWLSPVIIGLVAAPLISHFLSRPCSRLLR